ncbi:MAG: hypothetical protein ACM3TR_20655 [Caulobacteraceae bacterium]
MNHSQKKPRQNMLKVIDALTYTTLLRLILIIIAAYILVNYARFTPNEVIELVKSILH